jgi:DNA (cytosine-5)-methyltransferase 1
MTGDWVKTDSGLVVPASVAAAPKPPRAVDLFCGCGGFSLGLIQAGFHVLAGVDADPHAAVTYLINLGAYPVDIRCIEPSDEKALEKLLSRSRREVSGVVTLDIRSGGARRAWSNEKGSAGAGWPDGYGGVPVFFLGDIRKLAGAEILEAIGLGRGELDLVVGGPPCQGFSKAGRQDVMDPRNSLVFEFARLVVEMQPRTLCMEEVPALLTMVTPEGVPVVDELCRILERGDFGEFESLRNMLAQDPSRRVAKRGARPQSEREKERHRAKAVQTNLFGEDT